MAKYQVLVTGMAYVEVEAGSPEDAQEVASKRFDPLNMEWSFVCEECDLIEES